MYDRILRLNDVFYLFNLFFFILVDCITFIRAMKHTCQAHLLTHSYREPRRMKAKMATIQQFYFHVRLMLLSQFKRKWIVLIRK